MVKIVVRNFVAVMAVMILKTSQSILNLQNSGCVISDVIRRSLAAGGFTVNAGDLIVVSTVFFTEDFFAC